MKQILVFIFITCFLLTGFSQAYRPFPAADAVWRENKTGFQCSCCSDYQIFITGDTLIGAKRYHKLQKTGIRYQEDLMGSCTSSILYHIDEYVGCYRNDTAGKRVYFVPPTTISDTLLYDFDLALGDTSRTYLSGLTGEDWIVTNIDSVLLGGQYHKRFKLNNCYPKTLYLIEGMGSTFGLLSSFICWAPYYEHMYDLQCFKRNNLTVYPYSSAPCSLVSSVDEAVAEGEISVYPNPSTGLINISSNLHSFDLSIFTSTGQLIYREHIKSGSKQFDISGFQPGLYLIQLSENGEPLHKQAILKQ
jgi:hypothetical protein